MSLPAEIAGQSIAPGGPMRVIAEIGLNHNGDPARAHRLATPLTQGRMSTREAPDDVGQFVGR